MKVGSWWAVLLACLPSLAIALAEVHDSHRLVVYPGDYALFTPMLTATDQPARLLVRVVRNGDILEEQTASVYDSVHGEIFDPLTGALQSVQHVQVLREHVSIMLTHPVADTSVQIHAAMTDGTLALLESLGASRWQAQASALLSDPVPALSSSTITTMISNGPSDNRVDILLLGDGYTAGEMAKWKSDAELIAARFLAEPPYDDYRLYFNVHRIDTISKDSGVTHPEHDVEKDTAFSSYYNCAGIERLICGNNAAVHAVTSALTDINQRDIVVIVVNDEEYGGSGGTFAYASTHSQSSELVLHETAHSFGLLADEYDAAGSSGSVNCQPETLRAANVSFLVNREQLKWRHWVDPGTVIPTPYEHNTSTPGLYSGALYCGNLYRPTPNSKMRSLNRPFDAINEEALILRIHQFVSPVDGSTAPGSVVLTPSSHHLLVPQLMQPTFHGLDVQWFLDDAPVPGSQAFDTGMLGSGTHTVRAVVVDPTPKVRKDDDNLLSAGQVWHVTKGASDTVAGFIGNTLVLPNVHVQGFDSVVNVTMRLIGESPIRFEVVAATEGVKGSDTAPQIAFANGRLRIAKVEVSGATYAAELELLGDASPLRFELRELQVVDE